MKAFAVEEGARVDIRQPTEDNIKIEPTPICHYRFLIVKPRKFNVHNTCIRSAPLLNNL